MIIPPLPVTLLNGTLEDATEVMADFDWIVTNVNSLGSPVSVTFSAVTPLVSTTQYVLGDTASGAIVDYDALGQFNLATGRFSPAFDGIYSCTAFWMPGITGVTYTAFSGLLLFKNLSLVTNIPTAPLVNAVVVDAPVASVTFDQSLVVGDYLQVKGGATFSAGTVTYGTGALMFRRIG